MEIKQKQIAEEIIDRLSKKLSNNSRRVIQDDIEYLVNHSEAWKVRAIPGLSVKRYDTFREFIVAPVPWGLGWTMKVAEAFILPEMPEIWRAIEGDIPKAKEIGEHKGNQYTENGKVTCKHSNKGNARSYFLAVLKRDAPEIAKRVIAGKISAAEGMRQAGKRKATVTHPTTVDGFYNAIQKKLKKSEIKELKNLL